MGFSNRWRVALAGVLLWASISTAQNAGARITVLVNDSAGVETSLLRQAEQEAARLFGFAGIEIEWVNCPDRDECRSIPGPREFVLHIVPAGNSRGDFVFGVAFLGADGRGQYSDVFFDRVRLAQGDADVGRMLGAVSAHELGHLLLGSNSHSRIGIMEAIWEKDSVWKVERGMLLFTREQGELMRKRLQMQLSGAAVRTGSASSLKRVDN